MKHVVTSVMLGTALAALPILPARAQTEVFIEYAVTGSTTASGRDVEVVLCSKSEDGFNIHTMGAWVFSFDAPSADPGEYEARLRVAAPDDVAALHDDNFRTDDRLYGNAAIVIERAGTGQANLPLVRIRFAAKGLASDTDAKIDVEGTLVCAVM